MPCSLSVPLQDLEQDIRFYFSLCTQESELYMLNIRERTGVLFKRFSTLSLLRLVRKAILGLLTLQALTAAVLLVIAALGKRRKHEVSFPHDPFEDVQVGENVLRLYTYGRDLYDAMLEAIDAAQESIYLETYIWKDDAVGQEFRMHLARKAAEGVAVYVIFDSFGNLVVPRAFKSSFAPPIHVLEYSAIRHPWHLLDPRRYALDHRKLLIVDGTTRFIGGYNIGSTYATDRRGVDVRVLVPWISNHVLADWVAHSYFTDCLQGGVRIFGYRYTMLHAKTCTIDGQWSTVGTCNLDRLSLVGNYEINVAVYSE